MIQVELMHTATAKEFADFRQKIEETFYGVKNETVTMNVIEDAGKDALLTTEWSFEVDGKLNPNTGIVLTKWLELAEETLCTFYLKSQRHGLEYTARVGPFSAHSKTVDAQTGREYLFTSRGNMVEVDSTTFSIREE